jgi:glutamyl/glutaminyl-tRNA synthetase
MIHLFADGGPTEVAPEYAERMVANGNWFVCSCTHNFDKEYRDKGEETTVYHRDTEPKRHHVTVTAKS